MMHSIGHHQAPLFSAASRLEVNARRDASLFDKVAAVLCVASDVDQNVTQTADPSTCAVADDAIDDKPHAPYASYEDWIESIEATWEPDIDFYTNHNTQVQL